MKAAVALFALASVVASSPAKRAVAYYAPAAGGGSQLDVAAAPLGEPLNVSVEVFVTFHVIEPICIGYHLRSQLSGGTHRLRLPKLRQRDRLVCIISYPISNLADT